MSLEGSSRRQRACAGTVRVGWLVALVVLLVGAAAWSLLAGDAHAPIRSGDAASSSSGAGDEQSAPAAGSARSLVDGRLFGVVLDRDGRAVPDARCGAVSLARGESVEVDSDADGAFAFASVPDGELRLVVEAEGFLPHNELADPNSRGELRVTLRRRPMLRGRVVDAATGAPITEFVVAALALEADAPLPMCATPPPGSSPFTSKDGAFSLLAPATGPHAVLVFTERGAPWGQRVDLAADSDAQCEARIEVGARLTGRVRDARGDLVVDASVRVASRDGLQAMAVTGVDGSFALPALPRGAYELLVLPQAAPFLLMREHRIEGDAFLELQLPAPAVLSGAVAPWSEGSVAEVVITHALGPLRRGAVDPKSGAFLIRELAPGRCRVHVERMEPNWKSRVMRAFVMSSDAQELDLQSGQASTAQLNDPTNGLARARGRILGMRDGDPVVVRAFFETRPLPQAYEGLMRATPQADGSFEIEGLLSGRWRFQAMRGDDVVTWQVADVAPGTEVEISLVLR